MPPIGFSTGTLALGDFRLGLQRLHGKKRAMAVELSALRDTELEPLVSSLADLDLSQFAYVSVHSPSQLTSLTEKTVLELLGDVFRRKWPVVVHPDVIQDWHLWQQHGDLVCIENMDKRKSMGQTADALDLIFKQLPKASLCFDIGHARQIDPTMSEAATILRRHGHRLKQLHVSDVNSASQHEPLNLAAEYAFSCVAYLIPPDVPVIMETPVDESRLESEMARVLQLLSKATQQA